MRYVSLLFTYLVTYDDMKQWLHDTSARRCSPAVPTLSLCLAHCKYRLHWALWTTNVQCWAGEFCPEAVWSDPWLKLTRLPSPLRHCVASSCPCSERERLSRALVQQHAAPDVSPTHHSFSADRLSLYTHRITDIYFTTKVVVVQTVNERVSNRQTDETWCFIPLSKLKLKI